MQDKQSTVTGDGVQSLFAGNNGSLKCPRCGCLNTKFCYYNNYNLSQPRFFCKGCRRYWTNGGTLRNVPVGGSTRKTKRPNHKTGNRKNASERKSTELLQNSSSGSSVVSANISPETKPFAPTEAAPALVIQSFESPMPNVGSTDNHHLFSASEISLLAQIRDEDQGIENQRLNGQQWLQSEEWGLFDQSYWMNNNLDHQLDYLL